MEQHYGIAMPKKMREDFSYFVKEVSDHAHQELKPHEIYDVFRKHYLNTESPLKVEDFSLQKKGNRWIGTVLVRANGEEIVLQGDGNGQLNAVSNAICKPTASSLKTSSTVNMTSTAIPILEHCLLRPDR